MRKQEKRDKKLNKLQEQILNMEKFMRQEELELNDDIKHTVQKQNRKIKIISKNDTRSCKTTNWNKKSKLFIHFYKPEVKKYYTAKVLV